MLRLRDELKSTSYLSKFKKIEENVYNIAGKTRIFFPKYTNHGTDHLNNVENYVNLLIPDDIKKQMSKEEIFFLLCAVWLHDIGMVPRDEQELNDFESKRNREEYRVKVRKLHHIRSDNYIKDNYDKLGLNKLEARIIGQIAKGHRETELCNYKDINYNGKSIKIASLAAILRLADECDVSKERESKLSPIDIDDKTHEKHYLKHELVHHVWFNHEKGIIFISCLIENEDDYKPIKGVQDDIKDKLNQTSDYLIDLGINLCSVELDIKWNRLYEKQIISHISDYNFDISTWNLDKVSDEEIFEILDNLVAEGLFIDDNYKNGFKNKSEVYMKLFKKFGGSSNFKKFYFTKYSQESISRCFDYFVDKFSTTFNKYKENRIEILKNSPTAFYLMLKFEEILDDKNFNYEENINGPEMMDYLLLMSLFNDINYYKEEMDFNNVKNNISPLIRDKNNILELFEQYRSEGELNKKEKETNGKINSKSLLDLNSFNRFVEVFTSTYRLLEFNRIMNKRFFKFLSLGEFNNLKEIIDADVIIDKFNLKMGDDLNEEIPCLFNEIPDGILLTSHPDKLDIRLRIIITNLEFDSSQLKIYFCPKSEKIKDILNWFNFVENYSEKSFELKYLNKRICNEIVPKMDINSEVVEFYSEIDKFNDKFKLDITHEYDYEITDADLKYVEFIKSLENNQKIYVPSVNVKLHIRISELYEAINDESLPIEVAYNYFPIRLLNNNIDLGKYNVKIDEAEILNKEQLSKLCLYHDSEDVVDVTLIIKDKHKDKLTLDFSSNNDID